MIYIPHDKIINNPDYIQVFPQSDNKGGTNMNRVTHYTRVPTCEMGWDSVLYYRFIGSISNNQSPNNGDGGFVYIFTNNAYPGLIKIGMTTSTSEKRLKSVNSAGVVDDWQVEYDFKCSRPWDLEQAIHLKLDSLRSRKDREFFKIPISYAIKIIEETGKYYE